MNREQMVEKAAAAIVCDGWEGEAVEFKRQIAMSVLDAVLPQVTTVAELEALPYGCLLFRQPNGYETPRMLRWEEGYHGGGSLFYMDGMADASVVLAAGPLTVVWTPEVTA